MVASVKIVATPQGVKIEGEGYTGPSCSLDVAKILATMEISPGEAQPKPEFFLDQNQAQHQQGGQSA